MAAETITPIATHTPGPWEVGDNGVSVLSSALKGRKRWIDANGNEQEYEKGLIALVYACRADGDWSVGQLDANRRLIAAAPDYKALVDRAVAVLQRHAPPDGLSDHDAMSEFYGIFDGPEYRVAIAKAEGQS